VADAVFRALRAALGWPGTTVCCGIALEAGVAAEGVGEAVDEGAGADGGGEAVDEGAGADGIGDSVGWRTGAWAPGAAGAAALLAGAADWL
jgi:hypothetical protein